MGPLGLLDLIRTQDNAKTQKTFLLKRRWRKRNRVLYELNEMARITREGVFARAGWF